jgi:hypothetical protein
VAIDARGQPVPAMMHVRRSLVCGMGLLALAFMPAAAAGGATQAMIPKAFWGRWNPSLAACTGEGLGEIRIKGDRVDYYEETDALISIVSSAANMVRIRALSWSPATDLEKPSGKVTIVMKLLNGGQRLSYQVDQQRPLLYVRCKTVRSGAH